MTTRAKIVRCEGCGTEVRQNPTGRLRKWCSDRCRKRQYGGTCRDCGAHTDGSNGAAGAPDYCITCIGAHRERLWTRETCIAAIKWWADLYGEPPGALDWWSPDPAQVRGNAVRAERYARLHAEGKIPHHHSVRRVFGSWNAGIEAAGFTPRVAHGGDGNIAYGLHRQAIALAVDETREAGR